MKKTFPPVSWKALVLVCTLTLLIPWVSHAQTNPIDSLKQLIPQSSDSIKLEAMIRLAGYYRRVNMDTAMATYDQAYDYAESIDYALGKCRALYFKGVTNGMIGNYPESISLFKQSLEISEKINNLKMQGSAISGLGIVHKRIGDYPKALNFYSKQIAIYDSIQDEEGLANAYSNMGIVYDLMKEPATTLEYYDKAQEIYEKNGIESGLKTIKSNTAVLYLGTKEYEKALLLFKEAMSFHEKSNEIDGLIGSYSNIGLCFMHMKEYDSANFYMMKCLEISEQLNFKQSISNVYHNLAQTAYYQNDLPKAREWVLKNIEAAHELNEYHLKKEAYELAVQVFRSLNETKKALEYYDLFMAYKDSLFNETKVSEFERQQVQFDVYKKDAELVENEFTINMMASQMRLDQVIRWSLGGSLLLSVLFLYQYYKRYRYKTKVNRVILKKNDLISNQKAEIEDINKELEKRLLRAQMNPHFIFNALSSIQHLVINNERESAIGYLSKFSKLLRQILEGSINLYILLDQEIKLLNIYLELEALRFDNSFTYTIEVDDDVDLHQEEIPMLLVQPYVENAIIHGLMPKEGEKNLEIHFTDSEDHLICEITDNGVGINVSKSRKEANPDRKSRGMSVTEQRIKFLNENQHAEASVEINECVDPAGNPEGTQVIIKIPKRTI